MFVRFYLIIWALWGIVYQRVGSFTETTWPPFAISIAVGIITGVAFFFVAGVVKYVLKLLGRRAIYTPVFILPVVLIHGVAAWYIYTYASFLPSYQRQSFSFLTIITQNFIIMCLLDLIFAHYIAPNMKAKVHIEDDTEDDVASLATTKTTPLAQGKQDVSSASRQEPASATRITICGIESELGKIQKIESEGHYLNISEADRVHKVRGKFSDAVSNFPNDYGVQASRSCWVSKTIIKRALRDGSKLLLVLKDQKRVPVARARRPEVSEKLKNWRIEISRD